jgi:hypothetical protein
MIILFVEKRREKKAIEKVPSTLSDSWDTGNKGYNNKGLFTWMIED